MELLRGIRLISIEFLCTGFIAGDDADNVRYYTQSKQVVVGYGSGGFGEL